MSYVQVIPMSAARRLPSSSSTSVWMTGCGRVIAGGEPYSFTMVERSARALSSSSSSVTGLDKSTESI